VRRSGDRERERLARIRLGIEEAFQELASGYAVDHGVMDLLEERSATAVQAFQEVHLPEGSRPRKRARQELGHEVGELAIAARTRHRPAVEVLARVEARVVFPRGMAERERHELRALGAPAEPRDASLDAACERLDADSSVEDRDAPDVELRVPALEIQEARVARRHPARQNGEADTTAHAAASAQDACRA
jgi:hypothetical protein